VNAARLARGSSTSRLPWRLQNCLTRFAASWAEHRVGLRQDRAQPQATIVQPAVVVDETTVPALDQVAETPALPVYTTDVENAATAQVRVRRTSATPDAVR
jgi:hypothetical protein